jgi:hypothetical protein
MEMKVIEKVVYESINGRQYEAEVDAIQADKNYIYDQKINAILLRLPFSYDPEYFRSSGKAASLLRLIEEPHRLEDMIRAVNQINEKYK